MGHTYTQTRVYIVEHECLSMIFISVDGGATRFGCEIINKVIETWIEYKPANSQKGALL